jgi:hypothetical protein
MKRLGFFLLNIAVALYLVVNGFLGFTNASRSEFYTMIRTIFPRGWAINGRNVDNVLIIALSVCAVVAGILLLTSVFKNDVGVINVMLFIFIALWVAFIVVVDIINPMSSSKFDPLTYFRQLSAHLMVLGALFTSTKHFGRIYVRN